MENKEHIEAIIGRTFEVIRKVYEYQQEMFNGPKGIPGSRILFPKYRKDETRISEQELKQVFIEQLNKEIEEYKDWDVYYSVETPTEKKYRFGGEVPVQDDSGRSGNFDLVIHNNKFERIALIEFKANNPKKNDYRKDFLKLNEENCEGKVPGYFIQIVSNSDSNNLHGKIEGNEDIYYWCYSLEKRKKINPSEE